MPYKYLDVEFNQIEDLFNLELPVNVFTTFVRALGGNIRKANFNKYSGAHPMISIRFDFETEKEDTVRGIVFRVARELLEGGQIRNYDRNLRDWVEPEFVFKAHEIGTDCALELKNWMTQNEDVYRYFQTDSGRKAGFMTQLIALILKNAGLKAVIVWSILRESPTYEKDELRDEERVVSLASTCAIKCKDTLKELEKQLIPDFLERLIHAFCNCTYTTVDTQVSTEGQVLNWLQTSLLWKHIANCSGPSRLVEVYGSLLNSQERKGIKMEEVGKVERKGWKLSFDRFSSSRKEAVLNLVETGAPKDVYYVVVYRVDDKGYNAILEREMGKQTALKWKRGEQIEPNSYSPVQLDSEFGITDIFIIPKEERKQTPASFDAPYVKIVRKGIEESYSGHQLEVNMQALERAVRESQPTKS